MHSCFAVLLLQLILCCEFPFYSVFLLLIQDSVIFGICCYVVLLLECPAKQYYITAHLSVKIRVQLLVFFEIISFNLASRLSVLMTAWLILSPTLPACSLPQTMVRGLGGHPGSTVPMYKGAIASLRIVRQISGGSSDARGLEKILYKP